MTFSGIGSEYLSCPDSFPITIGPGNDTEITLAYEPGEAGDLDANASIESNDPIYPSVDIALTGDAVNPGPDIYLPDDDYDYGSVRVNALTRWSIWCGSCRG